MGLESDMYTNLWGFIGSNSMDEEGNSTKEFHIYVNCSICKFQ
jgi:hypothetical protein